MQRIDLMQKQIMKLTAELTTTQKSNAMLMVKLNEQQDQLNKLHYVVEKLEKTADGSIDGLQFSTETDGGIYQSHVMNLKTEIYEPKKTNQVSVK